MSELTSDRGVNPRPSSFIVPGGSADVQILTRIIVGLLRQSAADRGAPIANTIEGMAAGKPFSVQKVAEHGRAVIRAEFMRDEDMNRFGVRYSTLIDDLPDGSGKEGDYEITAHPIATDRIAELSHR
jgi:hypothetical protein